MTKTEWFRLKGFMIAKKQGREHQPTLHGRRNERGRAAGYGQVLKTSFIRSISMETQPFQRVKWCHKVEKNWHHLCWWYNVVISWKQFLRGKWCVKIALSRENDNNNVEKREKSHIKKVEIYRLCKRYITIRYTIFWYNTPSPHVFLCYIMI